MTREIKFRGKAIDGKYVYGLLTKKRIRANGTLAWAIVGDKYTLADTVPVLERTIAQLIARDKNGREVYEGDTVEYPEMKVELTATMEDVLLIKAGTVILKEGK